MKTFVAIFLLCIAQANAAVTSYPWYDVDAVDSLNLGLIAYWKLDEASGTRVDSEPTGTALNLTDNNTVTSVAGVIGNAAFFTAANNEYLSVADSAELPSGDVDFTITCRFKATQLLSNGTLASQWLTSVNQRSWRLWYNSSLGRMQFEVSLNGTSTTAVTATTGGHPVTNVWYFIAAWHYAKTGANTLNISINNGAVDSAAGFIGGVKDSTATFDIGARGASADEWDGAIDEVGLWGRLLTGTELTRLYNLGAGKTCCPFVP